MTYDTTGLKNLHMGLSFLQNSIHIFSEKLINIFNVWLTASFPTHCKEQLLLLFLKKRMIMERETITLWACSHPFQSVWKTTIWANQWSYASYCFSRKATAHKMLYWLWMKNGKQYLKKHSKRGFFLWIYQKSLIP